MAQEVPSGDAPYDRRLFISGIAPTLLKDELAARLKTYGTLTKELELNHKNATSTGIFAHCNLIVTASQWARLRKLSGTVLKGSKLRIEEARQGWEDKKALDEARPQPLVPNPRKRPPPGTTACVESKRVKRGEQIKDSQITQKSRSKGWIKGRYGRALAVLKRDGQPPLKRNPDALSRLWGSAHPSADQLTSWYDDEEEEWHDRRGRVIQETEIKKKARPVEIRGNSRVEVWDSDDETTGKAADLGTDDYTIASSSRPDYVSDLHDQPTQDLNEEEIAAQLASERTLALGLLGDMFKNDEVAEAVALERKEKRRIRDALDIVKRFDPNATESESETESEVDVAATDKIVETVSEVNGNSGANGNEINQGDDEEEPVPLFLRAREDHVNTEDLTSIFKPSADGKSNSFSLFESGDLSDDDDDEDVVDIEKTSAALISDQGMHPDRINRGTEADVLLDDDPLGNANYTALARDRGYNLSTFSSNTGVFPLLLSSGSKSIWDGETSFFGTIINAEDIKMRWEDSRGEVTRDWKRKRREGTKKMRKASARQGR